MKNLTRREFLKALVSLAAFALPMPKANVVVPNVQQNDKPKVTFFDVLTDVVTTIEVQADALTDEPIDNPDFDVAVGEAILQRHMTEQLSNSVQRFGHLENMVWTPGDIEPGATIYLSWDKGNSWECAGEVETKTKCTACDDGVLITDFDYYDLGNCDFLCALEHLGATVNRKAQDE